MLQSRTPDSAGSKKDTKEYVKYSFSKEKVANNNFESLESLDVSISQVNERHSNSAASKLAFDDMVV